MTDPRAQRTLVKSPPELWAEISDAGALTRHLGELGDIRITRLDPETTVAWEGDRVRGTVELEASGWGTKVTLTAQPDGPPAVEEEVAAPVAAPARAAATPLPAAAARRPALLGMFRRRPRTAAPEPTPPLHVELARSIPAPPPPAPAAPSPEAVEALLVGVLDELGSATKRPFSR